MQTSELKVKGRYTLTNATESKDRSWTHNVWEIVAINDAHVQVQEIATDDSKGNWKLVLPFAEYNWHAADDFCVVVISQEFASLQRGALINGVITAACILLILSLALRSFKIVLAVSLTWASALRSRPPPDC